MNQVGSGAEYSFANHGQKQRGAQMHNSEHQVAWRTMQEADVTRLVEAFEAAWSALDPVALAAIFDLNWNSPVYQPEEGRERLEDWATITNYWHHSSQYIKRAKLTTTSAPRAEPIANGVCLLNFDFHLDSELHSYAAMGFKPLGIDVRVMAIAQSSIAGEWKLTHYFEGSMGMMASLRKLQEGRVLANFQEHDGRPFRPKAL